MKKRSVDRDVPMSSVYLVPDPPTLDSYRRGNDGALHVVGGILSTRSKTRWFFFVITNLLKNLYTKRYLLSSFFEQSRHTWMARSFSVILSWLRPIIQILNPWSAIYQQISKPIPSEPPVTTIHESSLPFWAKNLGEVLKNCLFKNSINE